MKFLKLYDVKIRIFEFEYSISHWNYKEIGRKINIIPYTVSREEWLIIRQIEAKIVEKDGRLVSLIL